MSRIGKLVIAIPEKVKAAVSGSRLRVEGPKGKLEQEIHAHVKVEIQDNTITVKRLSDEKESIAFHGLMRALINNMVLGVSTGFEKELEIIGVGYRAALKGKDLELSLGYSKPVKMKAPAAITFGVEKGNKIKVTGCDKQQVGQIAATIRALRPPEPYKGKGVRYVGEYVRKKAGKAAATA
jgi:large subunit ribosomal protein L6